MMNLRNDIFARLVISAKALKSHHIENMTEAPEPEADAEPKRAVLEKYLVPKRLSMKPIEKSLSIEDKVISMVENPEIIQLKNELESVEALFHQFKRTSDDKKFLNKLESKIKQLKKMIEQKSFV